MDLSKMVDAIKFTRFLIQAMDTTKELEKMWFEDARSKFIKKIANLVETNTKLPSWTAISQANEFGFKVESKPLAAVEA